MAWVRDYFNGCDSYTHFHRYNNAKRINGYPNAGDNYDADSSNNDLQKPRAKQNVQIVTEGDRTFFRFHVRPAEADWLQDNGETNNKTIPQGTWCSFGGIFRETVNGSVVNMRRTYGRFKFDFRFSAVNTFAYCKHAVMLWPDTASAPPELDMNEIFGESTYANKDRFKVVHHKGDSYPSTQTSKFVGPKASGFFTSWHTQEYIWTPDRLEVWIDGVLELTFTDPSYIPSEPMRFDMGSALTTRRVLTSGTRTAGYIDIDNVEHYYDDGTGAAGSPPLTPQDLSAQVVSASEILTSYLRSSDPDGNLAGYEVQRGTSTAGPFATVTVANPETLSASHTGLAASTLYYFRVRAYDSTTPTPLYSAWSDFVSATTMASGSGSKPVAALAASPTTGAPPLAVTFSTTGTSGTITAWTLDYGDGTAAATGTTAPPSTLTHTYSATGEFTARLSVENANGQTAATAIVTVRDASAAETPFLRLPLPVVGVTSVLYIGWIIRAIADAIDTWAQRVLPRNSTHTYPTDVLLSSRLEGEPFPRFVVTADGTEHRGDGTYDPVEGLPAAGTPTRIFADATFSDAAVTTTSLALPAMAIGQTVTWVVAPRIGSSTTFTLPDGTTTVADGATATDVNGWTATRQQHSNGATCVVILRRYFSAAVPAHTATVTWGGSGTNYAAAWAGHENVTGFGAIAIDDRGTTTTATTDHTAPSVTTTLTNQRVLTIVAGKSSGGTRLLTETDADLDLFVQASSSNTIGNAMFVGLGQSTIAAAGATPIRTMTTDGGAFSVGAQIALTH